MNPRGIQRKPQAQQELEVALQQSGGARQEQLVQLSQRFPDYAPIWHELGEAHLGARRVEEARAATARALRIDPGVRYRFSPALREACRDLLPVEQPRPVDQPRVARGVGVRSPAEASADPARAALELAEAGKLTGHAREDRLEELTRRYPNHAPTWLALAEELVEARRVDAALGALQRALSLDPAIERMISRKLDNARHYGERDRKLDRLDQIPLSSHRPRRQRVSEQPLEPPAPPAPERAVPRTTPAPSPSQARGGATPSPSLDQARGGVSPPSTSLDQRRGGTSTPSTSLDQRRGGTSTPSRSFDLGHRGPKTPSASLDQASGRPKTPPPSLDQRPVPRQTPAPSLDQRPVPRQTPAPSLDQRPASSRTAQGAAAAQAKLPPMATPRVVVAADAGAPVDARSSAHGSVGRKLAEALELDDGIERLAVLRALRDSAPDHDGVLFHLALHTAQAGNWDEARSAAEALRYLAPQRYERLRQSVGKLGVKLPRLESAGGVAEVEPVRGRASAPASPSAPAPAPAATQAPAALPTAIVSALPPSSPPALPSGPETVPAPAVADPPVAPKPPVVPQPQYNARPLLAAGVAEAVHQAAPADAQTLYFAALDEQRQQQPAPRPAELPAAAPAPMVVLQPALPQPPIAPNKTMALHYPPRALPLHGQPLPPGRTNWRTIAALVAGVAAGLILALVLVLLLSRRQDDKPLVPAKADINDTAQVSLTRTPERIP